MENDHNWRVRLSDPETNRSVFGAFRGYGTGHFDTKRVKMRQLAVERIYTTPKFKKFSNFWFQPKKPLLVVNNIFNHTVMDFAWCDRNLLVCSQDGTVKVVNLSENLIGDMISNEAMVRGWRAVGRVYMIAGSKRACKHNF